MIRWGLPALWWAPALIAPAAIWFAWRLRRRERRLEEIADAPLLPVLLPGRSPRRARRRLVLWLAGAALVLAAFARPQWGFRWEDARRRGLNLIVVLDTSNSMRTQDLKPDRLQQAKWGIRDLVAKLRGDRVGLVAFAGSAFLQCPLTLDYSAFLMTLDDVYAGIVPRGGTAIGRALRKAIESRDIDSNAETAILLITDGEDHEGDPLDLVDDLRAAGVRVYAVGAGSPEGDLIPAGDGGFVKDRDGQVVKSSLREDVLQRLAIATGGAYVRAAPGDFGLDRLYEEEMSGLRRAENESRLSRVWEERFVWFLGAGWLLLAAEGLMEGWGRRGGANGGDAEPDASRGSLNS